MDPPAKADSLTRVRVLASELVNQIAAGEVVERPASVVKELVENAIDAAATRIHIVLENGGKKRIEVRDDGSGMSESNARLAVERHATSKIVAFDDLLTVRTLGFRGEALPSIASVSRFLLQTFSGEGEHGVEIENDDRGVWSARPAVREKGTTIVVRELFENVPARRKFLKSADAEFRSIVTIVTSYALPHPQRGFRLEHNGRVVLDLFPVNDCRDRILQIVGDEADEHLSPIEAASEDCVISGYVTRGLRYGSRRNQYFFVNGRLVRDRVLTHAANRAAESFDFDGHPAVFLFMEVPAGFVDVNVHPAKTEVRFRDSGRIHVAVEHGIRRSLGGAETGQGLLREPGHAESTGTPLTSGSADPNAEASWRFDEGSQRPLDAAGWVTTPAVSQSIRHELTPLFQREAVVQPPVMEAPRLGSLHGRVLGQYRMSYMLFETPDGLRLIDQHVAHERILYDRFAGMVERRAPDSQRLLTPFLYDGGAAETAILESHLEELRAIGFEVERFSRNTLAFSAIPVLLERQRLDRFFRKLIDASLAEKSSHLAHVRDRVVASLACQAAIKVHHPLSGEEMSRLTADLLDSSNPYACPHGRPIIVDIRHLDIEKHFHRK